MAVTSRLKGPLLPVEGIRVSAVAAEVRYPSRLDLVLVELPQAANTAAVFTRNAFCAAPVEVAKRHLADVRPRFLLVNTGNANAGTGERGIEDALECCRQLAQRLSDEEAIQPAQVLPFSTGVIGEFLPVPRIVANLDRLGASLTDDGWEQAAMGIMTTDTRPKAASVQVEVGGGVVTVTGIAKGAGMIKPNMATMLAFLFTDAGIAQEVLKAMLDDAVECSFNRISVDGDTSTNDACVLVASGHSHVHIESQNDADYAPIYGAIRSICTDLAKELIRDAEGATKFVTIDVVNGASSEECLAVGYAIAESPLVKTALFAADPNWGRILAVIGRAGLVDLDIHNVAIDIGGTRIVENGAVAAGYTEEKGQREMAAEEIHLKIDLGRGQAGQTIWTSDLSHDYVRINADYRT